MKRRQFLQLLLASAGTVASGQTFVSAQSRLYRRLNCPILMYHYVSALPERPDAVRRDLTVAPELFDQHCAYLVDNGYTAVSMAAVADALFNGTPLPEKPIVLTFDDGYADAYEQVLPTLQKYEMLGTFFVVPHFLDNPGYLSWGQVGVLFEAGMEVENHSMSHKNLNGRDAAFLREEVEGVINAFEVTFNRRPYFFCYPSGRFDRNTIRMVQETGHLLAVTTSDGMILDSSDPFRLPRVRIRGTSTVSDLAALLAR